jgi:TonB family protein
LRQAFQRFLACLLLLSAASLQPALAAMLTWTRPEAVERIGSAQQLQSLIDAVRKGVWTLYSQDFTQDADIRERTLKQDVDQWMMPPAVGARLDALHAKAQSQESAHQDKQLRKTLDEASDLVQQEFYRGNLINDYWYRLTRLIEQRGVYDGLEARLPAAARKGEPAQVKAAYTEAAAQLSAALSAANPTLDQQEANTDRVQAAITAIYDAYTEQRKQLGQAVGNAERANGVAPMTITRTEPCPPAPANTSASAQPGPANTSVAVKPARFAPNNRADEVFYPPQLRRLDLEGFVLVAATISPTGCPTKAEVYSPSGAEAFDQSALKWSLQATYVPAERDGKPVESVMRMGVRFQMTQ